jgi:hypothetical protein
MISSKLQAIGDFYLLSSIWELFSRYGWGGFGCAIPRCCSFPRGLALGFCLQISDFKIGFKPILIM